MKQLKRIVFSSGMPCHKLLLSSIRRERFKDIKRVCFFMDFFEQEHRSTSHNGSLTADNIFSQPVVMPMVLVTFAKLKN